MSKTLFAIVVFLLAIGALVAQDGTQVNLSQGTPYVGYSRILTYSAGNLVNLCVANSTQSVQTLTITGASNANPVSFTATAHGIFYSATGVSTPSISITGATGMWASINGIFVATPTSANAFTIPIDSTTFGTYTGQTPAFTTRAPLITKKYWAAQKLVYDATPNLIWTGWASDTTGANPSGLGGGTPSFRFACNSLSSLAYQ